MNDTQPTGLQLAVKLLAQIGDSDRAIAAVHAAADERDELRAKYDELLVALHCIGAALGIPEGDRSPYSVTCGVLERVNRLAEIEAQVATAWMKGGAMVNAFNCPPAASTIDEIMEMIYRWEDAADDNLDGALFLTIKSAIDTKDAEIERLRARLAEIMLCAAAVGERMLEGGA